MVQARLVRTNQKVVKWYKNFSCRKKPWLLGYITTQVYRDYNKPLYKDPYQSTSIMEIDKCFFRGSCGRRYRQSYGKSIVVFPEKCIIKDIPCSCVKDVWFFLVRGHLMYILLDLFKVTLYFLPLDSSPPNHHLRIFFGDFFPSIKHANSRIPPVLKMENYTRTGRLTKNHPIENEKSSEPSLHDFGFFPL